MSTPIFLDTSYILALMNTADEFHERAKTASVRVGGPFVTTEAVLIEIGNALARERKDKHGMKFVIKPQRKFLAKYCGWYCLTERRCMP